MLIELRHAHDELLAYARDFEALAEGPPPSPARLAEVRHRLSQLNLKRRAFVDRIDNCVAGLGKAQDGLRRLRADSVALVLAASECVAAWPPARVIDEWEAYRPVVRGIVTQVRAHIAAERELLYPLLTDPHVLAALAQTETAG